MVKMFQCFDNDYKVGRYIVHRIMFSAHTHNCFNKGSLRYKTSVFIITMSDSWENYD